MTVRAMDTRARLKGVHTLGLGADHSMSTPAHAPAQQRREIHCDAVSAA